MIVGRTTDLEEIRSILCHEDIFRFISEGVEIKPEDYVPPIAGTIYLAGYDDGVLFALACIHPFKDGVKYHPNVLKEHRLRLSRDFVKQSLTMIKYPVYVEIPKYRKKLLNFATKLGFDSIANNKDSTDTVIMRLKDGFY